MSRSPVVLRTTERFLHEWDHLPRRLQGHKVPPFISRMYDRDPQNIGMYAYDALT